MSRIRTIKPEFPQSESMGRVSRDARLLFIELWTICDDSGRARAVPRMLASLLFPYDDDAPRLIDGWLAELEREGCISFYDVNGSRYLEVRNWATHQRIDRPTGAKCPAPVAHPREDSRALDEPSMHAREDSSQDRDRDRDRDQEPGPVLHPPVLGGPTPVATAATHTGVPPAGKPRPVARTDDELRPLFEAYCAGAQQRLSWAHKYVLPSEQLHRFGRPPDVVRQVAAHYRAACDGGCTPSFQRFSSDIDRWHAEWQRASGASRQARTAASVAEAAADGRCQEHPGERLDQGGQCKLCELVRRVENQDAQAGAEEARP